MGVILTTAEEKKRARTKGKCLPYDNALKTLVLKTFVLIFVCFLDCEV